MYIADWFLQYDQGTKTLTQSEYTGQTFNRYLFVNGKEQIVMVLDDKHLSLDKLNFSDKILTATKNEPHIVYPLALAKGVIFEKVREHNDMIAAAGNLFSSYKLIYRSALHLKYLGTDMMAHNFCDKTRIAYTISGSPTPEYFFDPEEDLKIGDCGIILIEHNLDEDTWTYKLLYNSTRERLFDGKNYFI